MEKEITGSKQNQIPLEDNLQDYTFELSTQNDNLNGKMTLSSSKPSVITEVNYPGQTRPQTLTQVTPPRVIIVVHYMEKNLPQTCTQVSPPRVNI